ncbi:unnamed protein product, partial [Mesorhabditis spiculigera]
MERDKPALEETDHAKLVRMQFLAHRVADQKRALVELDERRQKMREAERITSRSKEKKTYVCMGDSLFIQCPTPVMMAILKDDRKTIEKTIEDTRQYIKEQVDDLLKLEGRADLSTRGFNLKPINEEA